MTEDNDAVPADVREAFWAAYSADQRNPGSGLVPDPQDNIDAGLRAALAADRKARAAAPGAEVRVIDWPETKITLPDIGAYATGTPYLDALIHRLMDAQNDINFFANETMSQSVADAVQVVEEAIEAIHKLAIRSAFITPNADVVGTAIEALEAVDADVRNVASAAYIHEPVLAQVREAISLLKQENRNG
jgi:hypothetical protein